MDKTNVLKLVCETPNTTEPYCGSTIPAKYTSEGYYVRVEFISDPAVTGSGFKISYTCNGEIVTTLQTPAPTTTPLVCGGQLSGPTGKIQSPKYPNNYPNNADCFWTIDCAKGESVKMEFTNFDLEYHSTCQ